MKKKWEFTLNKYQKVLNEYTKYSKMQYEHMWKDCIETFRWHRDQNRLIAKRDKEDNILSMIENRNLYRKNCVEDGLL